MDTTNAFAMRAVLKREGFPDTHFELRRNSFDFTVVINGKEVGRYWRNFSPQQLIAGNCPPMALNEAWQGCTAQRFPGYVATDIEELLEGSGVPG